MSNNNLTYQSGGYRSSDQQPQYTQYQQPTYQKPTYQQSTYQEQQYQQTPYTQPQYTQTQTQKLIYHNTPYQSTPYQQTTYQNPQATLNPQYTQYQQQFQTQYQSPQLTQQSLQNLPRPARNNMDVYLRDHQDFERVPQGLETKRDIGVGEWERRWGEIGGPLGGLVDGVGMEI